MLRLRTVRFFGLGFSSRRRKLFYILGTLVLFYLIYYFYLGNSDEDLEEIDALESEVVNLDKWIVMTTIHLPTLTVSALSQLVGWQVLVVGDRKTPKSWRTTNVIFLDVNHQKSLGYRVLQYLPYDSYTRKTIGYLYAIKHGAKYIYDVDDDNFPENGLGGFQMSASTISHLVLLTNNLTSNPYVHFGQSSLWPRGYPLERIGLAPDRTYDLCETRTPAIQQGVVNGDPDLDAIGRLTRKHPSSKLVLKFDQAAPPYLLPSGTFAPFNSQNTFFRQSAFWAMFLPTMVPDRVSDIFRSYWAQRLMWLIGENLAFAPPNAFQERNGHSDLEDAKDEAGLYHGVGNYIKELTRWKCSKQTFFDCVSELSHDLVVAGLWKSRDAEIVDAWIADLSALGYQPPEMIPETSGPCLSNEPLNVVFYPVEQNTTLPHDTRLHHLPQSTNHEVMAETLSSWCGPAFAHHWKLALVNAHKYSDSLLIISVYHNFETIVPVLEAFYKPNYPQILYCTNRRVSGGFMKQWKLSVLQLKETPGAIPCILSAFDMNYNVKGYLHITDLMWMKTDHQIAKKHTSLMWLTGEFDAYKPRTLKLCDENTIHCQPMSKDVLLNLVSDLDDMTSLPDKKKTKIRACVAKMERDPTWVAQKELVWVTDLALYLPDRLVPDLKRMREVFNTENQKPFEFMAPLLLECDQLTTEYLEHSEELESISPERKGDYVFPFPFHNVSSGSVSDKAIRKSYCAHFEQYS